ncbi:unnamed protein product, partial [Rotaria socialis]
TTTTNQRPSSLLPKRFNVRAWLRDRKTQVKISSKEPVASSSPSTSSRSKSPSLPTTPSQKSISSVSTKSSTTVPLVQPSAPPNISLRRKLGSIPVPKRQQTVR